MNSFLVRLSKWRKPARILLATIFILASIFHFTASEVELRLIPPFLPLRRTALYVTGVLEFVGGVGLLIPRFKRAAGIGLAALLVAIFPANVYHTFIREQFTGFTATPLYHILRWPMQGFLIWWALWCSKSTKK